MSKVTYDSVSSANEISKMEQKQNENIRCDYVITRDDLHEK